jgi:hypothetical protein
LLVQLEAIKIKLDHQVGKKKKIMIFDNFFHILSFLKKSLVNPVQLEAIKIKLDHQVGKNLK